LFSARAAQLLFPLQQLDGFGFDVEILFWRGARAS